MFRLLVLLLFFSHFSAFSEQRCSFNWVCIDVERHNNATVDFYLRNKKPFNITVTLTVEPNNMVSAKGNKITRTLTGNSRVAALSFKPDRSGRYPSVEFDYDLAVGSLNAVHQSDYLYRPPHGVEQAPVVVQGFNGGYSHRGLAKYSVDFAMPVGSKVYAARGGTVVDIEWRNNRGGASRRLAPYANFIVIEHSDLTTGEYYHLKQHGVFVKPGDIVERGQLIGLSGNTGFTSLPHLHFAVYKALADGETQSLPFKFITSDGIVERPRHGNRYFLAEDD